MKIGAKLDLIFLRSRPIYKKVDRWTDWTANAETWRNLKKRWTGSGYRCTGKFEKIFIYESNAKIFWFGLWESVSLIKESMVWKWSLFLKLNKFFVFSNISLSLISTLFSMASIDSQIFCLIFNDSQWVSTILIYYRCSGYQSTQIETEE